MSTPFYRTDGPCIEHDSRNINWCEAGEAEGLDCRKALTEWELYMPISSSKNPILNLRRGKYGAKFRQSRLAIRTQFRNELIRLRPIRILLLSRMTRCNE